MTFDIGNWQWTGEDAANAALAVGEHVVYIHLKHVTTRNGSRVTVPLPFEKDTAWRTLLRNLPEQAPLAIEFPVEGENLEEVTRQYVQLLASVY